MFVIKETNGIDMLEVYRNCLSDFNWRYSFGILKKIDINEYLRKIALIEYDSVIRLALIYNEEKVGFCNIQIIDPLAKRCLVSLGIIPSLIGRGFGVYFSPGIMNFIFKTLMLNKITTYTYEHNKVSYKIIERLGFTFEGRAREHVFDQINNKFVDVLFFGLLQSEYPNEFVDKKLKEYKYEYL